MKTNSAGTLNTIKSSTFGDKENNKKCADCIARNNSLIPIPKTIYMAILAVVLGGLLMTGCSSDSTPVVPVIPAEKPSPVQCLIKDMLTETLGLKVGTATTTKTNGTTQKTAATQSEVVPDISFIDDYNHSLLSLKLNKEESTEDKQVYYAKRTFTDDGEVTKIRYTLTKANNALIMKKEWDINGIYRSLPIYELTANPDKTVSQKTIMPDGSKELLFTYEPKTSTSITRITNSGNRQVLDKFKILKGN